MKLELNLSNTSLYKKLNYDSHVHFFGVGLSAVDFVIDQNAVTLNLPENLKNQTLIRGFGWSNKLPLKEFNQLCEKYPNKYFCISYIDGHSSFVSKNLLDHLKFSSKNAIPLKTGSILSEAERDSFYALIPSRSIKELKKIALFAQNVFLENGIKKIRHLTGNIDHWICLKKLESRNLLKLNIEVFFSEFMGQTIKTALNALDLAKTSNSKILSAKGIKIFYDGSLNSNTAYTSSFKSSSPRMSKKDLLKKMTFILCVQKVPLAVHTIGDLALQEVLKVYQVLSKNNTSIPTLHLEHAPIFTKHALKILSAHHLKCVFHFQPAHWIQDKIWYEKNKALLMPHEIYPFTFLDTHGYEYHFGSDAPVMPPFKKNTLIGLKLIEKSR